MATVSRELPVGNRTVWDYTKQSWRFILSDLAGVNLADISDVRERSLSFRLNRPQTLSFKMDLTHPATADLLTKEHCLIKAYKQGKLQMVAETSTIQVVGNDAGEHSLAVNATEAPWIRLAKRYIGQSAEGSFWENEDRGEIVRLALKEVNTTGLYASDSSVAFGSSDPTQVVTAGPWYFKPMLEVISELSQDLNGFDFWFEPILPTAANSYRTATLHLRSLRGAVKPEAVFEYGDGRHNARDYEWLIDLQNRITHAISLPATYPNNLGLEVQHSIDSLTESSTPGLKRREDIIQNDLVDDDLRQKLIDEHIRVRAVPRHVFKINPHIDDGTGRVPAALIDYECGDMVKGRVKDSGILMLNAIVRVYGIDISIDDMGLEDVALTVIDEA